MFLNIYFVIEGLFEKSDSIGYDCVDQYNHLLATLPESTNVALFASRHDATNYPGLAVHPITDLLRQTELGNETCLIYHFCDGWVDFEEWLGGFEGILITRWHNNTPPWFHSKYSMRSVERTIRGYRSIINLAKLDNNTFVCNSSYSVLQLEVLGIDANRLSVVYPASRFLVKGWSAIERPAYVPRDGYDLLFVGRLVAHKGHRHIIKSAGALRLRTGAVVRVHLPGRLDRSAIGYTRELNELALASDVELSLAGEIDQPELEELYRTASVFVCLSEHEGFGLPVFEAMQSGLPVVAWAATALKEMFQSHPLSVQTLDYDAIASRIERAVEPSVRRETIAWQDTHLGSVYTRAVVAEQLADALDAASALREARWPGSNVPRPDTPTIAREIQDNLMTLYDVESYEALLTHAMAGLPERPSAAQDEVPGEPGDLPARYGLHLKPSRFTVPDDASAEEAPQIPLSGSDRHVVFGPYIRLPVGFYYASLGITFAAVNPAGTIILDVAADGAQIAVVEASIAAGAQTSSIGLQFFNSQAHELLEFRVRCPGSHGLMRFEGVWLSRVSATSLFGSRRHKRQSLVWDGQGRSDMSSRFARVRSAFTRLGQKVSGQNANIEDRIAAGDRARDDKEWQSSVKLYADALSMQPSDPNLWTQYGHALKEAGRHIDSEEAYRTALRIRDDVPDTYLNMGHLMKLTGRRTEAINFYLTAAGKDPAIFEAVKELLAMGLSSSTIEAFMAEDDQERDKVARKT